MKYLNNIIYLTFWKTIKKKITFLVYQTIRFKKASELRLNHCDICVKFQETKGLWGIPWHTEAIKDVG
jgi:hypothetical protein